MKKRILSGVFALALMATVGYGVNKSMNNDANLSDLALANVEALAQGETNPTGYAAALTTLISKSSRCVNSIAITTETYNVQCLGEGDMACTPGTTTIEYESGRCA